MCQNNIFYKRADENTLIRTLKFKTIYKKIVLLNMKMLYRLWKQNYNKTVHECSTNNVNNYDLSS